MKGSTITAANAAPQFSARMADPIRRKTRWNSRTFSQAIRSTGATHNDAIRCGSLPRNATPSSRYLPLARLNVLVHDADGMRLGWLTRADVARLDIAVAPIFLGLLDGVAHFAIDVSELGDPVHELNLDDAWRFEDARRGRNATRGGGDWHRRAGRAQVGWHRSHRHCSACGAPTVPSRGGHVRICGACKAEHFRAPIRWRSC